MRACGGGARSDLWCQIKADVLRVPVLRVREPDASLMGAAVLACVGSGLHPGVREAVSAMVSVERRFEPRPSEVYERLYSVYRSLYPSLREAMWALTRASS